MIVVDAAAVPPRTNPDGTLHVRRTLGPENGFAPLRQAVLECTPGRTDPITVGDVEETLFVLGGRGLVHAGGESHPIEPEVGLTFASGSVFTLENRGAETLRLVAVQVLQQRSAAGDGGRVAAGGGRVVAADRGRVAAADADGGSSAAVTVCRLADRALEAATTQREFRIVADPDAGLPSATHFVGYIPTARAPEHFHTYDEVLYVLEGEGVMQAGDFEQRVGPGSCIQLPARTVHCLENTGVGPMRVLGVFCPPGSPADAYFPDGTPAFSNPASASAAGGGR